MLEAGLHVCVHPLVIIASDPSRKYSFRFSFIIGASAAATARSRNGQVEHFLVATVTASSRFCLPLVAIQPIHVVSSLRRTCCALLHEMGVPADHAQHSALLRLISPIASVVPHRT